MEARSDIRLILRQVHGRRNIETLISKEFASTEKKKEGRGRTFSGIKAVVFYRSAAAFY